MIALELQNITSHIDSLYSLNPNKFHVLVIKKEEMQQFMFNIQQKQQEIEHLNKQQY